MKILVLGGGPAGLYCALLIKKAHPAWDVAVIERNPAGATYGWGVVFSDRTLQSFRDADAPTYTDIIDRFVSWDAIDVHFRGETVRCGGHVFAGIARTALLGLLQRRCTDLGVALTFDHDVTDLRELAQGDLLIAADGVNSLVRTAHARRLRPRLEEGRARYIWYGTTRVLGAFTFIFRETEHGLFQAHAYPFDGRTSTFIVECHEDIWRRAGLEDAGEAESAAFCERLFAPELGGHPLLSNNSKWITFPTVRNAHWSIGRTVLLGDAAHTAHFSIGSGTKLAMEDAIALAGALERNSSVDRAIEEYEAERRPVVEAFQEAATESRIYFENIRRYARLTPAQFTFHLLTRSGRITYDDLRLRDARFMDVIDGLVAAGPVTPDPGTMGAVAASPVTATAARWAVAPPPAFTPLALRGMRVVNRIVRRPVVAAAAESGTPSEAHAQAVAAAARGGAGLIMVGPVAVSAEARITPADTGFFKTEHMAAWAGMLREVNKGSPARVGVYLSHAGRRGATRPWSDGLDRPLSDGPLGAEAWPLLAPSPLPYTARSQVPTAMGASERARVREEFVSAARLAAEAGFDLLVLELARGFLLGSFISPLTNLRDDAYGGSLENRMRFPLEVLAAVRDVWPHDRPLSASLAADDWAPGGAELGDAVIAAGLLKSGGCDMIEISAGHTVEEEHPVYGRLFLATYSDVVRNEADIPTMTSGAITTMGEVNTLIAAERADLCILDVSL